MDRSAKAATTAQQVAAAVRGIVAESGLSELALAEQSGIPRVTLRRRLAAQSPFTVQELADIGEVLGVSALDILKRSQSLVAA